MSNIKQFPKPVSDWACIKEGFREHMEGQGMDPRVITAVLDDLKACHDQVYAEPMPPTFTLNTDTLYKQQQLDEIREAADEATAGFALFMSERIGLAYSHLVYALIRLHGGTQ